MTRFLFIASFVGGGIALLFFFSSFFPQPSVPSEPQSNSTRLSLNVPRTQEGIQEGIQEEISSFIPVILSVQGQEYALKVSQGSTVYDAMNLASETSRWSFQGKSFGDLGFFVEEINGVSQDHSQQMYWIYSINGKKSQVGVSQYKLQPGDIISWTYEKEE